MSDGHDRFLPALALAGVISLSVPMVAVLGSTSAAADPHPRHETDSVQSVQARVERLYRSAEQASERYNAARIDLRDARRHLDRLETQLRHGQSAVDRVRERVASSVVAQYQGQGLTSTSQVLLSEDPNDFLNRLSTVSQFDDQQSQLMSSYAVSVERLQDRRTSAAREMSGIVETEQQLGADKRRIDSRAAEAKQLLAQIKERARKQAAERAQDRSRQVSRSEDRAAGAATPAAPASGRAAAAVRYALAQVGHAYVYGAAGPGAFDCSGLTMRAWQQAGVSLPHSSSAQMGSGRHVSQSQLQPGDLVFYYSPVSHVGMYIGHGQIVNAENPGAGVRVTGVNSMPYAGAVRPG